MNWIWILIIKKKKTITDHFDFGLSYFILVTGKFFEKNFFIDIYINFKSILEKFFCFYPFVKSYLKKFPILMSSKSFLILYLPYFSEKKPMILKNLNLKFSQIKKSPINQYFIQFVEFQRGNCKKRKNLHQFISEKYKTSKIFLFQDLIYQKKGRRDFCSNYISVQLNHKKLLKRYFNI